MIMIEDCRFLIWEINAVVVHVQREANRCMDKLAKIGGTQSKQVLRMLVLAEERMEDLKACFSYLSFFPIVNPKRNADLKMKLK